MSIEKSGGQEGGKALDLDTEQEAYCVWRYRLGRDPNPESAAWEGWKARAEIAVRQAPLSLEGPREALDLTDTAFDEVLAEYTRSVEGLARAGVEGGGKDTWESLLASDYGRLKALFQSRRALQSGHKEGEAG